MGFWLWISLLVARFWLWKPTVRVHSGIFSQVLARQQLSSWHTWQGKKPLHLRTNFWQPKETCFPRFIALHHLFNYAPNVFLVDHQTAQRAILLTVFFSKKNKNKHPVAFCAQSIVFNEFVWPIFFVQHTIHVFFPSLGISYIIKDWLNYKCSFLTRIISLLVFTF